MRGVTVEFMGMALLAMAGVGIGSGPLAGQTRTHEVALTVEPAGRLVVPVQTADGRTLRFAVSTAVPSSMVAASLAGGDPAALGLRLDGLDGPFTDVAAVDDRALEIDGHRVDGFLGLHTLGDVDVLLDAPGGRLLLQPIGRRVDWSASGVALSEPARLQILHGVAIRLETAFGEDGFGATLDLATPANVANEGVARAAGLHSGEAGAVAFGGVTRSLVFTVATTPVLDRWDPEQNGFVAFGASLAADCALSISYVHQELRTCVR